MVQTFRGEQCVIPSKNDMKIRCTIRTVQFVFPLFVA